MIDWLASVSTDYSAYEHCIIVNSEQSIIFKNGLFISQNFRDLEITIKNKIVVECL